MTKPVKQKPLDLSDSKKRAIAINLMPVMTNKEKTEEFREALKTLGLGMSGSQADYICEWAEKLLASQKQEIVGKTRELISCKSCNGSGRADSMSGAAECPTCGGDGHCLDGHEGENIDTILSALEKEGE